MLALVFNQPPAAPPPPPPIVISLRGQFDAYALSGALAGYTLQGAKDSYPVTGQQDTYAIRGATDLYSLQGKQDAFAIRGRQEDAGANIMPLVQNFSVPLGDDASITLTCLNSAGTAFDLTGCSLLFSVKAILTDGSYLFQKSTVSGIVIGAPATNGIATLTVNASDTTAKAPGGYQFDLQVTTGTGKKSTLITGTLTLTDHPSR